jgi:hypothetical protein
VIELPDVGQCCQISLGHTVHGFYVYTVEHSYNVTKGAEYVVSL